MDDLSTLDLFRMEAESQAQALTAGLLILERDNSASDQLEMCMRAAHSLKGAARVVELDAGVRVAHAMEDCFVAVQQGRTPLTSAHVNMLLEGVDLLLLIAHSVDSDQTPTAEAAAYVQKVARALTHVPVVESKPATVPTEPAPTDAAPTGAGGDREGSDRALRVTAENLNRLLGVTAESLVASRWVKPFSDSLVQLKRMNVELTRTIDGLRETLPSRSENERAEIALARVQRLALDAQHFLSERLVELEMFDRRSLGLSRRLHDEAVACRMRPFADGVQGFPRMVRDVARSLGKQVTLEIVGHATQVDRDILSKLDAPLGHLLRNAVDHGIEAPDVRVAAGKPPEGRIRLEARHRAGALQIEISDDGCGVDIARVRASIVARNLINRESVARLTEAEVLDFLFLPGFTMKETVSDVSGRGVGLDVVQDMVKQVRGAVRVSSQPGKGTRFVLQLPVTLSVVRTLLADIGGEPYAFPLASIVRTLRLPKDAPHELEGRPHFDLDGRRVGLVSARQVLDIDGPVPAREDVAVIVLGGLDATYGLVVDRFLGECELVAQPLGQFGKVKDISAGALMEDGSPVLIVDTEDLIRSMDRLVSSAGRLKDVLGAAEPESRKRRKRVLVVDDSLTVREIERKLLGNHGYQVEVAVDGMDGWNAVRAGHFDLVVTDIDMPRLDGIELVTMINRDPVLKGIPVMVVSYKDREEDRRRGLDAGAAYYLTKGSFHDETLIQAVVDLIGEANA
jgi:two-component system, chemotaxis family, sensor histidine kinase and response regulator WspE